MRGVRRACLALALLSACGGGDGAPPAPPPPPPPPPPLSSIPVSLSAPGVAVSTLDTQPLAFSFTATSAPGNNPVVADVQFDRGLFRLIGLTQTGVGAFKIDFATTYNATAGDRISAITFRLCQDATCAAVYPSSSQTFSVAASIGLDDWRSFQRDSRHTGYVPVALDPSKFSQLWEWSAEPGQTLSFVATLGDRVFTVVRHADGGADQNDYLYAISETASNPHRVSWLHNLGVNYEVGIPAVANGRVYLQTVQSKAPQGSVTPISAAGRMIAVDAASGVGVFNVSFPSFGTHAPWAPAVDASRVYALADLTRSGFDTDPFNEIIALAVADGTKIWSQSFDGPVATASRVSIASQTFALDDQYIYLAQIEGLAAYAKSNGAFEHYFLRRGEFYAGDYRSAPLVGDNGLVYAMVGGADDPAVASSVDLSSETDANGRGVRAHRLSDRAIPWGVGVVGATRSDRYVTAMAYRHEQLFLGRGGAVRPGIPAEANTPMLDVLNASDGALVGSWTPPAGEAMRRNTVVTDNLIFVSTDRNVYAIDRATLRTVWTFGAPGDIAISANQVLYILTGANVSDGKLVAIRLR